jgi:hypothetical protein
MKVQHTKENIMSKFINASAKTLIAATLVFATIAPLASAGNAAGATSTLSGFSQAAQYHNSCAAPKSWVKVCVAFGPSSPGKLFGPCLHYELECQSQAYTGQ